MNQADEDSIELVKDFLEAEFADAAEPLWDLDDDGNPIYVDVGCATWVYCELFDIQDNPIPMVERDGDEVAVIIQARIKWSHWDFITTREFYVPIFFEEEQWKISTDWDWKDVSIDDFEEFLELMEAG